MPWLTSLNEKVDGPFASAGRGPATATAAAVASRPLSASRRDSRAWTISAIGRSGDALTPMSSPEFDLDPVRCLALQPHRISPFYGKDAVLTRHRDRAMTVR